MTNRKFLAILSTVAVIAIAESAFADAGPDAAAIFKSKCAMCHAPDGSGNTPTGKSMKVRDLRSAEVQKKTVKELFTAIADGKGKMPAYKSKLSQADIEALVSYIRSLKK
jgi:mono/diheme cytochrome c family protein